MSTTTGEYGTRAPAEVEVHLDASSTPSHVSWGAIIAGAVVAVAVGAMLNLLGLATASSLVETVSRETPTAQSMAVGSGIWLAVTTALGIFIGALVAARLAGTWDTMDAALHGLAVWAVSMLIAMTLVGSAVSGGVAAGARGLGDIAGGAVQAAGAGASAIDPEQMLERLSGRLFGQADAAQTPREQAVAEATEIFARRLRDGSWSGQDRQRLETLVANVAGVPQQEAAQRIQQTEAAIQSGIRQAEETARQAADAAAKSAAVAAFWAFAAMLLGIGAAVLGARMGMGTTHTAPRHMGRTMSR